MTRNACSFCAGSLNASCAGAISGATTHESQILGLKTAKRYVQGINADYCSKRPDSLDAKAFPLQADLEGMARTDSFLSM